jgi:hypothetical protein
VARADQVFPGSSAVTTTTYENWRAWLMGRIKEAFRPGDLVTHLRCEGKGCDRCGNTGKAPIGDDPIEEHRLELAARMMCLGRYSCPPERWAWLDQALDDICKRWAIVTKQTKTPF